MATTGAAEMIALLKTLGLKFWAGVVIFFTLVAGVVKIYSAGRKSAQADGMKQQLENVQVRNEVENEVRRAGPDAVHDELRKDWSRD